MQSISWYVNRLKTMSPNEIGWRATSLVRDCWDRICIPLGLYPQKHHIAKGLGTPPGFSVTTISAGAWTKSEATSREAAWYNSLLQKADHIAKHRLSYFDLHEHDHGHPFKWHFDHAAEKQAPKRLASLIDYRDFQETGDCKLVWEPNRHHHLVVLGRAYLASGNVKYAEAIKGQLLSWMDENPYGYGMNWRSPMELSIRVINWVWALDMIRESRVVARDLDDRLRHCIFLHLHDVTRKFSRGSSANNHLIGEAAGVFIASCYFPDLPNATTWKKQSFDILCREIITQMTCEGCHRELALGYHYFVLQFFLFAGIAGRQHGMDFPAVYWQALERMFDFLRHLAEGGKPPLYGDCDDGYVLDLGNGPHDFATLLSIGAALFNRPDFKWLAGENQEPLYWLLGENSLAEFDLLDMNDNEIHPVSHSFSESGFYLLQHGYQKNGDRISVLIDCGELGFTSIAAHGHADALSFSLRIEGHDILVDPGTYDYFSHPDWRNYFRSTKAHNTLEIDNEDQSVMLGPFLWGKRAATRCLEWNPSSSGGKFVGEHDGYSRLKDPVLHRRTMELDGTTRTLVITDEVKATSTHHAKVFFHCAPDCIVEETEPQCMNISLADQELLLTFDPDIKLSLFKGDEQPISGWVSSNYHCKQQTTTIVAERECKGSCQIKTVISMIEK